METVTLVAEYTHPHPSPAHIMRTYRRHVLSFKFKQNEQRKVYAKRVARGLIHYKAIVQEYLAAKRLVFSANGKQS